MMARSTWHSQFASAACLFIVILFICDVRAQLEKQPWYEKLPAVAMDYKVHLDAGKEDCYYQYVQPGATFYVSFQV